MTTTTEPVTVVEGRTLKPGHESDYNAWVHRTIAASERFPGNQGITILAPEAGQPGERYLVIRFIDEAAKQSWRQSEVWTRLLHEAATFSTPHVQTATGLEPWFVLPDQAVATPPKWKMFLTIIPAAYVISAAVVLLLGTFLHNWPFLVVNLIVTAFLGFLLTYVGLPLSTRLLHSWLYPA
jgi:antibiotic biosynthesis monooxygenase (ABM) superfamily enzyme